MAEVAQASLQFLPGDLVKAALAALITTTVVWAYPPIVQERERERVPA